MSTLKNVAVDSNGDVVGWSNSKEEYTTAVHLLLKPENNNPSRCFFFKDPAKANIVMDDLHSQFFHKMQRIELCKVEKRSLGR